MDVIKGKLEVNVVLPKADMSGFEYSATKLIVTTEFKSDYNQFTFILKIPDYIYNAVLNLKPKYTNGHKENNWSTPVKFTKTIRCNNLSVVLTTLNDIIADAMETYKRDNAKSEKFIAVSFDQSNTQERDGLNHADMGFLTMSRFQYFVFEKIDKGEGSLDRFQYRTRSRIGGGGLTDREWAYYTKRTVDAYKIIPWSQEREDFLKGIQSKFVELNEHLEQFLGDLNEDKLMLLMQNNTLFLGTGK